MVHALKMGYLKTRQQKAEERLKKREKQFYMLWKTDDTAEEMRRIHDHIPAPKRHLPGHAESYNPPAEYLFNNKEVSFLPFTIILSDMKPFTEVECSLFIVERMEEAS